MKDLTNLSYFLITNMEIEFKPQANPSDNYDLLTVTIMDLNTLETHTITDRLPANSHKSGSSTINGTLAKILLENGVNDWSMTYYHLHNNVSDFGHNTDLIFDYCTEPQQFFFNAIKLKDEIKQWNDIIFIPSSERQQIRLLKSILEQIRYGTI